MFRKSQRASRNAFTTDLSKTLTIMVFGEPDSGKTAFIKRLNDGETADIADFDPNNQTYWGMQTPSIGGKAVVNGINVRVIEVPGSRGRMSNYYEMTEALKIADVAVYCLPLVNISYYADPSRAVETITYAKQRMESLYKTAMKMDSDEGKVDSKTAAQFMVPPMFVVGTFKDRRTDASVVVDADEIKKHAVDFFEISSLKGEGVQEALQSIVEYSMKHTAKGRKLAEAGETDSPAAETAGSKRPTTEKKAASAPANKTNANSTWNKLMGYLGRSITGTKAAADKTSAKGQDVINAVPDTDKPALSVAPSA